MIMDIATAVDAMQLAEGIDEMVLFSGDTVNICQPAFNWQGDLFLVVAIALTRTMICLPYAGCPKTRFLQIS